MSAAHGASSGWPRWRVRQMDATSQTRDHRHQVHRPVLRIEQCGRDDGHRHEVARAGRPDRPLEGEEPETGEKDDQRVHARLGGVVHVEGRAGQQHHHRPRHRPPAEAPPAEIAHREGEDGKDPREGADGIVGLAEQAHPEVEQDVVERRRPVVLEGVRKLVQRQAGNVDRESLVEPQPRASPEAEQEPGRHDHGDADPDHSPRAAGEGGHLVRHGPHGRTPGRGLGSCAARRGRLGTALLEVGRKGGQT